MKREGPVVFREKLDPKKTYALKDYCWKCLDEGYASTATVEQYGNPLCEMHKNVDPECMEGVFIRLLKSSR
jgi:hypothetical protein